MARERKHSSLLKPETRQTILAGATAAHDFMLANPDLSGNRRRLWHEEDEEMDEVRWFMLGMSMNHMLS